MTQSSEELANLRDEKDKQLVFLLQQKSVIDQEYAEVSLQIARLDLRKKELSAARVKVGALLSVARIESSNLKDRFFTSKRMEGHPI